jgi:colicin import membrane protein
MKNSVFIIVLLLIVSCNLSGIYNIAGAQVKNDTTTRTNINSGNKVDADKKDSPIKSPPPVKGDIKTIHSSGNINPGKEVTVKKTDKVNEWKDSGNENKDKAIGKTKDGKIIYEGPRGGHYYISTKGRKVYIKKN